MSSRSGSNTSGRGKGQANRQKSKPRSRSNKTSRKRDPVLFWGDPELLPDPERFETETSDTTAVIASLGLAPIPGQGSAAHHFFKLVYNRASGLAVALAHAGGLDNLRTPDPAAEASDADGDVEPDDDDDDDGDPSDDDEAEEDDAEQYEEE